uniref:Interleukin-1 n=1 Tax=Scleropages formosus TaxID=113540 RepID=A0A8C9RM13_SCLFO
LDESPVTGGVSILHSFAHGQHHYQVEKVVKHKMGWGHGSFVRRGDKLLQINGISLQNLPPEAFAQMLTENAPILVSARGRSSKIYPFSKEHTVLCFSMEMKKMDALEDEGGKDRGTSEDEVPRNGSQSCLLENLLLVTMTKTRFSIIAGRGCDKGKLCQDQSCKDCHLDVVMEAKSCKITQGELRVSLLQEIHFLQEKALENIFIHSLMSDKCIQNRFRNARMSSRSKITIYYYKSDIVDGEFKGVPVVLNFSGTDCFLKCTDSDGKAVLSIEVRNCEKSKLRSISTKDKDILAFVFYMKASQPDARHFESANCPGWCLSAKKEEVGVEPFIKEDESFFFLIRKG